MERFKNRTAVITGGSKGIGKEIAEQLAREGANIAVVDIDGEAVEALQARFNAADLPFYGQVASVTEEKQVEEAFATIFDRFGSIDILVNNAGITRDNLLFKMSHEDWASVMDVHLTGAFFATRAAQAYMTKQGYGRIINISSSSAQGNRGQANYATAKAGLQGFTKTLAIELGQFGITTNAIAPGFIETDMTAALADRLGISFEQLVEASVQMIPVGRSGKPADIANAVLFFADEKSSFVNGQVLYVSGGPND